MNIGKSLTYNLFFFLLYYFCIIYIFNYLVTGADIGGGTPGLGPLFKNLLEPNICPYANTSVRI